MPIGWRGFLEPEKTLWEADRLTTQFLQSAEQRFLTELESFLEQQPQDDVWAALYSLLLAELQGDSESYLRAAKTFPFEKTEELDIYRIIPTVVSRTTRVSIPLKTLTVLHAQGQTEQAREQARDLIALVESKIAAKDFPTGHYDNYLGALAAAHGIIGEGDQARNYVQEISVLRAERSRLFNALIWMDADRAVDIILERWENPRRGLGWTSLDEIAAFHWSYRPILLQPRIKELIIEDGKWLDYLSERVPEYADLKRL